MNNQNELRRKILLITGVVIAIFLMTLLIFYLTKGRAYEYEALVSPTDSTFTIDGKRAKAGKIKLANGQHTLKASRELFEDAVVVVNTNDLHPGEAILVLPRAVSAEAKKWLADHPDDSGIADKIGAIQVAQRNQTVGEKYPIVNNLPYTSIDFKIDYAISTDFTISFTITLYPYAKPDNPSARQQQLKAFKAEALQYLSDNGINPATVSIGYIPAEATGL